MQKTLVAYFSYSGNAQKIAQMVHDVSGADIYEIVPETPYSADYQECVDQARNELAQKARPAIASPDVTMSQYDRVILVFPNWCRTCPMIVLSFVEKYDMTGKVIDMIVTNGGGGVGDSQTDIAAGAKGATVNEAVNGNDVTEETIKQMF